MKKICSRKKSHIFSFILFITGVIIISFFKLPWWPEMALLLGITNGLNKYLTNNKTEMIFSLIISLGIFFTVKIPIDWNLLLPTLFIVTGIYLLIKECVEKDQYYENEFEEDINDELKEDHK